MKVFIFFNLHQKLLKKRPDIFQIIDRRRSEAGNEEILSEESECVAAARIGSDDQVEFPNAICSRIFENKTFCPCVEQTLSVNPPTTSVLTKS